MKNNAISYFVAWAVLGLSSFYLEKKAQTIKLKKLIGVGTIFSIFILMYLFIHTEGENVPKDASIFLLLSFLAALFMFTKFTHYCTFCKKRLNLFGKPISFCPSCGKKLIK